MFTRSKCCIVGIPDHIGVINVGGRIGAARGPEAFRKIFFRFRGRLQMNHFIEDAGDVSGLSSDINTNHQQAADLIFQKHEAKHISVVIGGGHDHGYSHLVGISKALEKIRPKIRMGCINIDAHLDVRKPKPQLTSGSPFYLALESELLDPKRFIEFGIQSHCNSLDLWEYVNDRNVKVVEFSKLRRGTAIEVFKKELQLLSKKCDAIVISLDLDSIASAFAPGVSAPQAEGFTPMEIIEMMEIAGAEKKTVSLGIFELNPEHDQDDRTARLAATSAYHFIESALSGSLS